jgi:hypothetical protein
MSRNFELMQQTGQVSHAASPQSSDADRRSRRPAIRVRMELASTSTK